MADIADLVCARIQIIVDKKDPTIPTAASDSVPYSERLPTTAASVEDNTGSAIPAMIAGNANCWILLNEMSILSRNNAGYLFRMSS